MLIQLIELVTLVILPVQHVLPLEPQLVLLAQIFSIYIVAHVLFHALLDIMEMMKQTLVTNVILHVPLVLVQLALNVIHVIHHISMKIPVYQSVQMDIMLTQLLGLVIYVWIHAKLVLMIPNVLHVT